MRGVKVSHKYPIPFVIPPMVCCITFWRVYVRSFLPPIFSPKQPVSAGKLSELVFPEFVLKSKARLLELWVTT